MRFSEKKKIVLRPEKELLWNTFFIALGVAAAFFVPFMIYDNGYFLFYGDFNVQQVPFYQMCHQMVREGRIGWNWNTDLGVNFIGSYSFYLLGSPFFWLTLPFPNDFVPYLMGPLLILKFACSALTAYLYIRRFTKSPITARLGALLYAFSGFSVYNIFFNHFHEAIIVFPLLLLSIELLLTENRRGVFALMVAVCSVTNYFFFFGMVVFCVIYWIVRLACGCYKLTTSQILVFCFEAVIGLLISAFMLLPSAAALSENSRLSEILLGWSGIMYGKEQIYGNILQTFFFPPDIPARPVFFPGADVKWSSLGGWMPLFSMVGVFAFIQAKKGHWLRRSIMIFAFMALVPFLNSAFYMFNHAYYARWFYMPILLMALATSMAIEDRDVDWNSAYKWVLGITVSITLVFGLFPDVNDEGKFTFGLFTKDGDGSYTYLVRFWVTCAIAVVALLILWFIKRNLSENPHAFITSATAWVCILSVCYAAFFIGCGKTHGYESKSIMIDQLIEGEVELGQSDDNVFRIDTYDGVDNTGMYLGLYSINAFHSIVPTSVTEFYEYVGEERGVGSRPTTDSFAIRSLLSCKYLLNRNGGDDFEVDGETKMPGWSYYDYQCGYNIYNNENYIPFGFTYDYYMSEPFCEQNDGADRAELMIKAILLDHDQINRHSDILKNIDDDYYCGDYDENKEPFYFTDSAFAENCSERAETATGAFSVTDNGFRYIYESEKENLLFFSVPYDEGWSAMVNGKETMIEKVNVGFMAVRIPAGSVTVEFTYKTPMLNIGIIISLLALVILVVYLIIAKAAFKNGSAQTEFPEGDELLEVWKSYDMQDALSTLEEDPVIDEYYSHPLPIFDIIAEDMNNNVENKTDNNETGYFDVNIDE